MNGLKTKQAFIKTYINNKKTPLSWSELNGVAGGDLLEK